MKTLSPALVEELRSMKPEEMITAYLRAKTGTYKPELMIRASSVFELELRIKELIAEVQRKKDLPQYFKHEYKR